VIQKLLIGSGNNQKVEHYRRFLGDVPFQIVDLPDFNIPEPEESGKTFEENALIKVNYYFEKTGLPVLADDGGLEIPALGNFPGTQAHRFAGHDMSDEEVIAGIIEKMKDLKGSQRKARFRVVLALRLGKDEIYTASGTIEGTIPEKPLEKRMPHFPYRSLLYVDSLGKWFFDVTEEEENRLGYRRAAVEKLKPLLLAAT
jgi:XTP/dITP diphosphohydrolase